MSCIFSSYYLKKKFTFTFFRKFLKFLKYFERLQWNIFRESDVEVNENIEDYEDNGSAKTKPKSNKKKTGDDEDVAKVTKGVKKMSVKSKKQDSDQDSEVEVERTPLKAKKSAFEMLMGDDDDEDDDIQERPRTPSESEEEEVKPKKNQKGNKKSKKAKRKNDSDEEDIDKVLAELQAEYTGQPVAPAEATVATCDDIEDEVKSKKNKKKGKVLCSFFKAWHICCFVLEVISSFDDLQTGSNLTYF